MRARVAPYYCLWQQPRKEGGSDNNLLRPAVPRCPAVHAVQYSEQDLETVMATN